MNPGSLNTIDGADCTRELTLKRAQMVDILNKARSAERIRLVKNLVADITPLGRPLSASFMRSLVTLSFGTMITLPSLRSS